MRARNVGLGVMAVIAFGVGLHLTGSNDAASTGDDAPASSGTERAVARLDEIDRTLRSTRYRHATHIDRRAGRYDLDCSGLLNHVLRPAAPRAFRALGRERPVARTYARTIAAAPTDAAPRGWRRVARLADARAGDVFAFQRPSWSNSRNTGHVGFFTAPPRRLLWLEQVYVASIVDSTSLPHGPFDARIGGPGGYGHAEVVFVTNPDGAVTGFGWWGLGGPIIPIDVEIGRAVR